VAKALKLLLAAVAAGAVAAVILLLPPNRPTSAHQPPYRPAGAKPKQTVLRFHSRPDLRIPAVQVNMPAHGTAPGYVFFAPKSNGGMIVDNRGQPIWYRPMRSSNLRVQIYRGRPVLTWWEAPRGRRRSATYVIVNRRYKPIKRFRAGHGYSGDLHEFRLLPRGTAMITAYDAVRRDLRSVGGPRNGVVLDSIAQEIKVKTGRVVWEWHSLDHVPIRESFVPAPKRSGSPYDYFHINSIARAPGGDVLVSGRDTHSVYRIDRSSGNIVWRIGGKRSNFKLGKGARFAWQHDAYLNGPGELVLFDNSDAPPARRPFREHSRGLVLRIDGRRRTATLKGEYVRPQRTLSSSQANAQLLPNGNVFVGWGSKQYFTEFSPTGEVLFDAQFATRTSSYRCYRMPWVGRPAERPAIASAGGGMVRAWASWNGDTEVATWRLLAGPSKRSLQVAGSAPRSGFETAVTAATDGRFVAMEGLDAGGDVLGRSAVTRVGKRAR
jgi:hypothetical protein